jgi:hypothetical protein
MYTEISLPSKTGKSPHVIMKEHFQQKFKSNEFDRVFDRAYQIGQEQGTAAYDKAIEIILETVKMPEDEVFEVLRNQGVNV